MLFPSISVIMIAIITEHLSLFIQWMRVIGVGGLWWSKPVLISETLGKSKRLWPSQSIYSSSNMTRSKTCVDPQTARILSVMDSVPEGVYYQFSPLFGLTTPYPKLHNAAVIEKRALAGILLDYGLLFTFTTYVFIIVIIVIMKRCRWLTCLWLSGCDCSSRT